MIGSVPGTLERRSLTKAQFSTIEKLKKHSKPKSLPSSSGSNMEKKKMAKVMRTKKRSKSKRLKRQKRRRINDF